MPGPKRGQSRRQPQVGNIARGRNEYPMPALQLQQIGGLGEFAEGHLQV